MKGFSWDPERDPFAELNTAELDDTPIGRLRVIPWGHAATVARVDEDDPSVVLSLLHTLKVGENPLAAIYGKRHWEQQTVQELYDRQADNKAAVEERADNELSHEFMKEARKLYNKTGGEDALAAVLGYRD